MSNKSTRRSVERWQPPISVTVHVLIDNDAYRNAKDGYDQALAQIFGSEECARNANLVAAQHVYHVPSLLRHLGFFDTLATAVRTWKGPDELVPHINRIYHIAPNGTEFFILTYLPA